MKKLFLILLVLLVGMTGLSAAPPVEGGADDALQIIMPQADITVFTAVPEMPEPMRPGGIFVAQGNEAAFTQDLDLICLWSDQYREGLLSRDEFKTLVAGRIAVMYMRDQAGDGGMRALAKKTRERVDRYFYSRELKMGIRKATSLDTAGFPLLC